jgi:HAD superfamily phosphoserine phosphatase-like hydrolase
MKDRRFAVFDIDGTLFRWQLYYAVVLKLREDGFFNDIYAAKIDTAFRDWESRTGNFHEFEKIAIDTWNDHLTQLPVEAFKSTIDSVLKRSGHKTYAYTLGLAKSLKNQGYFLLAVSGSQQEIAEPFVKLYGFDDCIGWLYEHKDGHFTGKTLRNTIHDKAILVQEYVKTHDLTFTGSIAIGDSKGDISMLRLAERSIAFNPSQELLDEALKHDWEIVVERKNIAYTMKKGDDGHTILAQTDRF